MPRQQLALSHLLLREVAVRLFPETFDFSDWQPQVEKPAFYQNLLAPLGDLDLWETEYFQKLVPNGPGNPVRHFTQSTAMRPILERLDAGRTEIFIAEYDRCLASQYPLQSDGTALVPFRRLFFTLAPN